jgi:hypothetical protein
MFPDTIDMNHAANIGDFYRIVCAIINKYHPTINMQGANAQLARTLLERAALPNVVQARVEQHRLHTRNANWIDMNQNHLPGFPRLTLEYLRDLTAGTYQVRLAPGYIQDKLRRDANQVIQFDVLFDEEGLLRARVWSRHVNADKYQIWIAYNNQQYNRLIGDEQQDQDLGEMILGYYCTCKAGARTVGACAHVASILWFLGHARHEEQVHYPTTRLLGTTQDVAGR